MNHSLFTPIIQKFRNIGWQFVPSLSYSRIRRIKRNNLEEDTSSVIEYKSENMPVHMENPFQKDKKLCVLCKYEITPNYKNTRLLSQFVSRFTGKVYGRHITGLCKKQQRNVEVEIIKANQAGLMPGYFREPRFAHDPKLFDPNNPFRPHRF